MNTTKLTKQEYQKRSLAITKLVTYLELSQERLAVLLSELVSPIGEPKHPYRMTENEFMGHIEKFILKLEEETDEYED